MIVTPPSSVLGGTQLAVNQTVPPNLEVGTTGLAQFSGLIFQEPLIELRGKAGHDRYNEMRLNSPIISALLLSIENPLRSTSWEFASDEENDPRLDLLNEARENLEHSWNDFISEALTLLPFGFSMFEMVYEQVGGQMLWKSFSPRGQDTVYRWLYDEIRNDPADPNPKFRLKGFVQLAPPKYVPTPIPLERLLMFRLHSERDNPEGRSILRAAWVPYFYIKHLQQIEAIGLERMGPGFPVITLPQGATTGGNDTDDAKAAKIVRNVRNDEQAGMVLPFGWEFEFARGGATFPDYDRVINRHEKRILTSTLAQFLMLGQDGVGSLALSKDQTDFFTMSVNAVGDIISETFTQVAIPQLMALNGYDAEGLRLEHTPAQGNTGVSVVADFLQKVGSTFITWTPEDEVWLRQVVNLPEKDVDFLAGEMENRQAQKDAAAAALQERFNKPPAPGQQPTGQPTDQPPADKGPQAMGADLYAAAVAAVDARKRAKREREFQGALNDFLGKEKRRVLKAAKGLK
jgi:hypothetical protein